MRHGSCSDERARALIYRDYGGPQRGFWDRSVSIAPFYYAVRPPVAALLPWIVSYWEFAVRDGGETLPHRPPPDGCTSVVVICAPASAPRVMLSGPWLEPLVVPATPGNRYAGFRCRPDTGGLIAGTDPANLRNRSQAAEPLLGRLAAELGEVVAQSASLEEAVPAFDRLLLAHIAQLPAPEPVARAAVSRIWSSHGDASITAVAETAGVSPRTLLRRFRSATGMTPKQYARIARFWHAAITSTRDPRPGWSRVAAETGYADQAHLSNEFTGLTGLSPGGFEERVSSTRYDWPPDGGFPQDPGRGWV